MKARGSQSGPISSVDSLNRIGGEERSRAASPLPFLFYAPITPVVELPSPFTKTNPRMFKTSHTFRDSRDELKKGDLVSVAFSHLSPLYPSRLLYCIHDPKPLSREYITLSRLASVASASTSVLHSLRLRPAICRSVSSVHLSSNNERTLGIYNHQSSRRESVSLLQGMSSRKRHPLYLLPRT